MSSRDDPIAEALALVEAYCASRVPAELSDQVRVECCRRGRAITIVERRPPWNPEYGTEWSTQRVAQARHEAATGTWTLHAADRNGGWFRYDVAAAPDVMAPLIEIENDPTGIFWG